MDVRARFSKFVQGTCSSLTANDREDLIPAILGLGRELDSQSNIMTDRRGNLPTPERIRTWNRSPVSNTKDNSGVEKLTPIPRVAPTMAQDGMLINLWRPEAEACYFFTVIELKVSWVVRILKGHPCNMSFTQTGDGVMVSNILSTGVIKYCSCPAAALIYGSRLTNNPTAIEIIFASRIPRLLPSWSMRGLPSHVIWALSHGYWFACD